MDLHQLFLLKEKLLQELEAEVKDKNFPTEAARKEFYFNSMETIINFYARAMITILDSDDSKSRAA